MPIMPEEYNIALAMAHKNYHGDQIYFHSRFTLIDNLIGFSGDTGRYCCFADSGSHEYYLIDLHNFSLHSLDGATGVMEMLHSRFDQFIHSWIRDAC